MINEKDINRPEDGKDAKFGLQTEANIEKIKKLFALAGNNPNLEEANSAMAKAQAMMAKFGLTEDEIKVEEAQDKAEEMDISFDKTNQDIYTRTITNTIAKHFKCMNFIRTHRGLGKTVSKMVIVGMAKDLPIVKETIVFAYAVYNSQFKKFMSQFKKTEDWKEHTDSSYYNCGEVSTYAKAIRADYFRGFIKGMEEKFTENEKSYALIVKTPHAVIEYWEGMKFTTSHHAGLGGAGNSEAFEKGKAEGRAIGSKQRQLA